MQDRGELRALEPTMVWDRWRDVQPISLPPIRPDLQPYRPEWQTYDDETGMERQLSQVNRARDAKEKHRVGQPASAAKRYEVLRPVRRENTSRILFQRIG